MKSVKIEGFYWPADVGHHWKASVGRIHSMLYICRHWKRRKMVVQAGGSYGIWPFYLSKYFDWVYTFEPHWKSFHYLNLNCPFENVIKLQAAMSNIDKGLLLKEKSFTGHKVSGLGYIPGIRVDTLRLLNCDAIMVDVEGYEYKALQGAKNTIKEFRPVILFEYRPGMEAYHNIDPNAVLKFLEKLDYEYIITIQADQIWAPREVKWKLPPVKKKKK